MIYENCNWPNWHLQWVVGRITFWCWADPHHKLYVETEMMLMSLLEF